MIRIGRLISAILVFSSVLYMTVAGAADLSEPARKVFRDTKARADRGEAEAQLAVASMYASGMGTSPDLGKAVKYHRRAAELNLPEGQYQVALDYARGLGVKEDKEEAAQWYLKAAQRGLIEAEIATGLCLVNGDGVKPNGAEAMVWFRKAAAGGSSQAEYEIGKCYLEGNGVPKDVSEGVKYVQHGAELGFPAAQNYLGMLYERGIGVEKNLVEAYKWYALAAAKDDANGPDIRVSLAKLESQLTKEQVADAQRMAREFKPSAHDLKPGDNTSSTTSANPAGIVRVDAQDNNAEVFVDGKFSGNSPAKLQLADGSHVIEVKKSGLKDYRREINVTSGSDLNLRVKLEGP